MCGVCLVGEKVGGGYEATEARFVEDALVMVVGDGIDENFGKAPEGEEVGADPGVVGPQHLPLGLRPGAAGAGRIQEDVCVERGEAGEDGEAAAVVEQGRRGCGVRAVPVAAVPGTAPRSLSPGELQGRLAEMLAAVLYVEPSRLSPVKAFVDLGVDSILGVEFVRELNGTFGLDLTASVLYDLSLIHI